MAILTAAGRPAWTFALTGPLVPLAIAGCTVLTPRFGMVGPALVTTGVGWFAALASLVALWHLWGIFPSAATVVRSLLLCGVAYVSAKAAPSSGIGLIATLAALSVTLLTASWLLEGAREGAFHRLRRLWFSEIR